MLVLASYVKTSLEWQGVRTGGLTDASFQARNNELAIEDMDGGTFTISNGGVFGSMMGTPIINPLQSAILGMHAINERPVAINGKVGSNYALSTAHVGDG